MKFTDPTGNGKIIITQTYHGETHDLPDTQCAIDIRMGANEFYHSVCSGIVEGIWGDYISIIPDSLNARVLYVHTNRPLVKKGDKVIPGQKLGQIAPIASPHLHIGMKNKDNSANPPRIMDYFDRTLNFTTDFVKYPDIAKEWFVDQKLNWNLSKDLQYGIITPPNAPELQKLQEQVNTLQSKLDELAGQLVGLQRQLKAKAEELVKEKEINLENFNELTALQKRHDILNIEKNRIENERDEAVKKLGEIKNGRFFWLVGFLENLFPKK